MSASLVLRNVRPMGGALTDFLIHNGVVANIELGLKAQDDQIDCRGLTLLPGLIDHHIHLLATASKLGSVDLAGLKTASDVAKLLLLAKPARSGWVRAIGYDERIAGMLDRSILDAWRPDCPVRVQDRTGALWMLNSLGLEQLGTGPFPDCVDLDSAGNATGRIWRGDAWLRDRLGGNPPSLVALGAQLARHGVTGVTDASANNGPEEAVLLSGAVPQRLMLMGREDLPSSPHYIRGPLKLLYDERDLPDVDTIAARIGAARAQGRNVAAHCVTVAELLLYLAALDTAGGAQPGDRIEHGSVIPESLIPDIAQSGLTIITQPGFVATKGDRYMTELDGLELPDIYRLRALMDGGISVAAGSDAPYGEVSPWVGIKAAQDRLTRSGKPLGLSEALSPQQALALSLGTFTAPGRPPRSIEIGGAADLILVDSAELEPVCLTLIGGEIIYRSPN
jgi:predicted amidohydrolase YtcJ